LAFSSSTSTRRRSFPTALLGRLSRNSTTRGSLYGASDARQWETIESASAVAPALSATNAFTTSPRVSSGTPIAAASATPPITFSGAKRTIVATQASTMAGVPTAARTMRACSPRSGAKSSGRRRRRISSPRLLRWSRWVKMCN
jgi:hypothetical protein